MLEVAVGDPAAAFATLMSFLKNAAKRTQRGQGVIVASGIDDAQFMPDDGGANPGIGLDQIDALVVEKTAPPGWVRSDSPIRDRWNELSVAVRKADLIAVHCTSSVQTALHAWLDSTPAPPVRRVAPEILQGALLSGDAKGLWLRGTHARRDTKADSKVMTGQNLREALDPSADGSFALGSARAVIPHDPSRTSFTGVAGTTPRKALVWSKSTPDFPLFLAGLHELLELVETIIATNAGSAQPFELLAVETTDLALVHGAYELVALSPFDLPSDVGDDVRDAAKVLENANLDVDGAPATPNFDIAVGFDGATSGTIRGHFTSAHGRVLLSFGIGNPPPTDPIATGQIRDALGQTQLVTVYFASGHAYTDGVFASTNISDTPFPNWRFEDFSGFSVTDEKPDITNAQARHDAIGIAGESSLFSWVARTFSLGWLTCDDGPGEIADFIHLAHDGTLTLIHVKGADSSGPNRRVAAGAYELVASQAAKNALYLDTARLVARLGTTPVPSPATWTDLARVADRKDLIDMIGARAPTDRARVVIVQPHLRGPIYSGLRGAPGATGTELLRLNLLETLLNTTRASITGRGADLEVIASN